MALLVVPLTVTHGPTSVDEQRELFGQDMHFWGLLLGTIPNVLIAGGLWRLRISLAGVRSLARAAITVMAVAMLLSAAMDLAFRALGPPFLLFILAPMTAVVAATLRLSAPNEARVRRVLGVLAAAMLVAVALALVPTEASDAFGGYRMFGAVGYGAVGLGWASLGLALGDARAPQPKNRDGMRMTRPSSRTLGVSLAVVFLLFGVIEVVTHRNDTAGALLFWGLSLLGGGALVLLGTLMRASRRSWGLAMLTLGALVAANATLWTLLVPIFAAWTVVAAYNDRGPVCAARPE